MTTPPTPHRNQQLFSDYYLNAILPKRPEWLALAAEAQGVRGRLAALFAAYVRSSNEAQLEQDVVRPVLLALGHTFEVQPALRTPDGTKKPDYVFYRDAAGLAAQKNRTLTDALPKQGGIAVGDAKYWDRPLDMAVKAQGGDVFSNKNPSYQIAFYVQHSGVDWGILTNGRLWRLYHKDTAHKLDRFYEVDLPALLESGDAGAFLYFFAFFRRAAFDAHGLGVSEILKSSEEYARGVGESLKRQVFEALRHLAQGFLDYAPNGLALDAGTLKDVYDSSLILLYRLLFLLYAEARELLPVRTSEPYRETYGLHAIKNDIARGKSLLPGSATLWPRLKTLFGYIDKGEPPLKVATFNGGLFDPQRHEFLERHTVGDARLQAAIDRLARVGGQFVDYRDLSVRHLGTIYEGLLEFHLQGEAPEAPEAQEAHHLASQGPPETGGLGAGAGGWTVALVNDKGERKATGSYYTPDYIVKYIVERAVGPMLREAVAGRATDADKVAAVLAVNVLDPAMGSGHFLVEATEYIAAFLVEAAVSPGADGRGEGDLLYWKRRVAQSCIYGVDLNPLAVELAKLSLWLTTVAQDRPLSFLDHHLRTGNALVGARLADLKAHESAKKGRKKASAPVKNTPTLFEESDLRQSLTSAVDRMAQIEGSPAETVADVKRQEQDYRAVRDSLVREYGQLASVVTARHFGVAVDQYLWKSVAGYATGKEAAALPQIRQWVADADRLAAQHRFFHWELEFPEVFFDHLGKSLGDRAGFDAVIGNPPYIRQEELGAFKPYFAADYPEVYHGVADLFVYFFGQGLRQLQRGGRLSFISSNSWLRANYAGPLRGHLRGAATLETLVDLGDNRVFADAPDVYPAIPVVRREPPGDVHTTQAAVFTRGEGLADFAAQVTAKLFPVTIHDQADSGWQLGDDAGRQVFAKLMACGQPLGQVVDGQMYRGVLTGLNEAFIIDTATRDRLVKEDPASADIIRPLANGEDVRSWYVEDEGCWLILFPDKWTRHTFAPGLSETEAWERLQNKHTAIASYLEPFAVAARNRADKGEYWWELRPCTYYDDFDGPKIFWPEMAKQPRMALAAPGLVCNKTAFFIPGERPELLGLLMSRAVWFATTRLCVPIGERGGMLRYTLSAQFMARLPIPNTSDADKEALGGLAMTITEHARARYQLHCQVRKRLQSDLGAPTPALNQKLTAWWGLDFAGLRAEMLKVYKKDIPVKDRDEWEAWFAGKRAEHERITGQIVAGEADLNARVYGLFGLTAAEVAVVEAATKYGYGAV